MPQKINKKQFLKYLLTATFVVGISFLTTYPAYAGAVSSMSIDDSGTVITYSATAGSSAAVTQAITTATTLSFTLANTVSTSQTIKVTLNGFKVTAVAGLQSTNLTAGGTCSGTATMTTIVQNTEPPVLSITNYTCTAGAATIAIAANILTTSSTASNYNISVVTPSDAGSVLFYVGNENQALITGFVDPSLSFVIRNAADSADATPNPGPNTCALTPNPMVVNSASTCNYRLKVATNAASGYTVKYASSANGFYNGTRSMTNALSSKTSASAGSANEESYGIVLTPGSASNGSVTRDNTNFGSNATFVYPIISTTYTNLVTSTGPNAPASTDTTNTTLVSHESVIRADTPPGGYSQTVTYNVVAAF